MPSMRPGERIDKSLGDLMALIEAMVAEEAKLVAAGCLKAHIHFKAREAGGEKNIMYMYEPVDRTGRRPYHHVGVSSAAQAVAVAKVEREQLREQIAIERRRVQAQVDRLTEDMDLLSSRIEALLHSVKLNSDQEYQFEIKI